MGFWNKQHDYMDDFQTHNWSRLSEKERLNRLQSLENDMAKEQGRAARKVEKCRTNYCGYYDRKQPDKIFINQDYLDKTLPCDQYDAMNTVIHEGRHAYQHDCVEGKIHNPPENPETISMWSKNNTDEIYFGSDDFSRYRFQPIEADANDYADGKLASYKDKFDKDPSYENYMDSINTAKSDDIKDAARNLDTKPDEKEIKDKIAKEINDDYAWNHRSIPTREEQDQAFSKLCTYGEKHYGEDWRQKRGDLVTKDPQFRELYQTSFPNHRLPPMENTSATAKDPHASSSQNGSAPTQNEADSDVSKKVYQERGQKTSSTEGETQSRGTERGQKPAEGEKESIGNNSTPRGEKPQEVSQNTSNVSQTQRGTPPGSTGGEDSKAPTSSTSNPNDKISASSSSAKAADEASKVAAEQAAQNTQKVATSTGMGM